MHPLARTNNFTNFKEYAKAFPEVQPDGNGLLCDMELPENLPDMFVLSSNGNYIVRQGAFKKWIIQDGVENQLARALAFSADPAIGTPPHFLWSW